MSKRKHTESIGKTEKKQKAIVDLFSVPTSKKSKNARKSKRQKNIGDVHQVLKSGKWTRWDGTRWQQICEDCKLKKPHYGTWHDNGMANRRWCMDCAKMHEHFVDFTTKCEDYKKKQRRYGTWNDDGTVNKRWCSDCAKMHDNYVDFIRKCEECKEKQPHYGTWNDDGTANKRWCVSCAKKHDIYVDFTRKCEDCKEKTPTYGTLNKDGIGNRRWCLNCAKTHDDYIDFQAKCEDCKIKTPHYGTVNEDKTSNRKWCLECARKHASYVDLHTKCVSCQEKRSSKDGYCTTCHPNHIPSMTGSSKQACEFIDELEKQLQVKIQHQHYDKLNGSIFGNEKSIEGTKYRFDGFVMDGKLSFAIKEKGCGVEFHGVEFHGYPNNEHKDEKNYFGKTYGELYEKTIKREQDISALGYTLIRIFSNQYEDWKKRRMESMEMSLLSYCMIL